MGLLRGGLLQKLWKLETATWGKSFVFEGVTRSSQVFCTAKWLPLKDFSNMNEIIKAKFQVCY